MGVDGNLRDSAVSQSASALYFQRCGSRRAAGAGDHLAIHHF
jgi:hypothetical protein